jgi:general secretion pathway protein N
MTASSHPLLRLVLAVFATWSLGVFVVVETGLGSRYSLHPDAEPDAAAVPEVALVSGIGSAEGFERYASIVQRPLFSADRRPPPPEAGSEVAPADAAPAVPLNVVVTSIVLTGDKKFAIVTDPATNKSQTLGVGAALAGDQAGWRLVELQPRRAVFDGPGGRSSLDLRVFDGQGGEPPTPVAAPVQASQGEAAAVPAAAQNPAGDNAASDPDSPEARAEAIRKRIEERRRQMREEAERANAERGQ